MVERVETDYWGKGFLQGSRGENDCHFLMSFVLFFNYMLPKIKVK